MSLQSGAQGTATPPESTYDEPVGMVAQLRQLLHYRHAIAQLRLRELKARYKNTALGFF